jgi:hypothetical protein
MYVRFEVLAAVDMKSYIFWDITPCISLKVNLHFGRKFPLHLQGRRISQARNQGETGNDQRLSMVPALASAVRAIIYLY